MREVLCVLRAAPLDSSTGSVRTRRLARRVCEGRDATTVVLHGLDPASLVLLAAELDSEVVALDVGEGSAGTTVAHGVLHPRRAWPPVRLDVQAARSEIEWLVGDHVPKVVWCAGAEAWLSLPRRLRAGAVVDLVDLPSRNRRELARVAMHRLGRRFSGVGGVDASAFGVLRHVEGGVRSRHLERYVAERAGALVVASPNEADGRATFHVVRTGVDEPDALAPPGDPYAVPHFVFPGSFLYPPHQDAAEWFALYALAPLRRLVPASRVIYAGECPDWMYPFGELHGIDVTGPLADPASVFDQRTIVIAPIRSGSGTVVEVVEAWARCVPVVATSRGIEGLGARPGDDVLVADDPEGFAAACAEVALDPQLRARLAANGRARYEAEFRWDRIGADLLAWLAGPRS